MLPHRLGDRVANLETGFASLRGNVTSLSGDVQDTKACVGDLGGKIDKLVDGMAATGKRAAQRTYAVRDEMSAAADRRAQAWKDIFHTGVALLGAIALIVAALTGPWKEKLGTTATRQVADTAAIAAAREVLTQQGAGIGRNTEAIASAREVNRDREARVYDHENRLSLIEGRLDTR